MRSRPYGLINYLVKGTFVFSSFGWWTFDIFHEVMLICKVHVGRISRRDLRGSTNGALVQRQATTAQPISS